VSRSAQGSPLSDWQEAFEAARQDIPSDLSEDARAFLLDVFAAERPGRTVGADRLANNEGLAGEVMPYLVEIIGRENVSAIRGYRIRLDTPGVRAWGVLRQLAEQDREAFTDSAVPKLAEVLADDSKAEHAQADAAKALGWSNSRPAGRALADALESESSAVRVAAARSLGNIGGMWSRHLREALQTGDERLQITIMGTYSGPGQESRQVLPAITELLGDDRVAIRRAAAQALGRIGSRTSVVPLSRAVADEDNIVQRYAAKALADLEDPRATIALIDALTAADAESPNYYFCVALGTIRDRRAVPALIIALGDENIGTRRAAATALGNIADVRAVEPLIAALEDEDAGVTIEAAAALGKLNDPRAIEPLVLVLVADHGSDFKLYRAAAASLEATRHPDVVYILIDHMPDEYWLGGNIAARLLRDLTGELIGDYSSSFPVGQNWRHWKARQVDQAQQTR